jgi:glycine/D-amino acid oxidase-like deaminating enzyme
MTTSTGNRQSYRELSLWHETVQDGLTPRPSLAEASVPDRVVDVAIVGAGFTGLWTAYYLKRADPSLRIAVLESETAGFGASGRNGGWCSALYPVSITTLAAEHGRDQAIAQYRAMQDSVNEIATVIDRENLQADWAKGGTVTMIRSSAQAGRANHEIAEARQFGFDAADIRMLGQAELSQRVRAVGLQGAVYTPHCAALQPAKLARSLADTVEASGVTIYEQTPVRAIEPGRARTRIGDVRAEVVVRATEGFTPSLSGVRRAIVPVYSLIIATEPLPASAWDEIGLAQRETFTDFRHLIIYGQRTADDRLVFGGRGAPYHFGSRVDPSFDRVPAVFTALRESLTELFPVTRDAKITHSWGGPLGVARDWHASVGLDASTGLAWAGGYVGDGVSTTNLAGRTLSDLILRRETDLTSLPWVDHHSPAWEPEPLRWLGANAGLRAMTWADASEQRRGKPSRIADVVNKVLGR